MPGAPGEAIEIPIEPPTKDGEPLPPPTPTPAAVLPRSNLTGQVFSGSNTDSIVSGTSLTGEAITAPTRFINVGEDGTVAARSETGFSPA